MRELYDLVASPIDDSDETRTYGYDRFFCVCWTPVCVKCRECFLVELNGKPTAGLKKDTVVVPAFGRATVDLVADQPGLTLFHCHMQQHMDFGFMALFRYV